LALFAVGSLIGKAIEVDMEFTRERSIVRMLVDVTRAEFIPKTTVDHVYDGEGYGLLFKAENGNGDVDDTLIWTRHRPRMKIKNMKRLKNLKEALLLVIKKPDSPPSGAVEPK
jgi:hypothetical protein